MKDPTQTQMVFFLTVPILPSTWVFDLFFSNAVLLMLHSYCSSLLILVYFFIVFNRLYRILGNHSFWLSVRVSPYWRLRLASKRSCRFQMRNLARYVILGGNSMELFTLDYCMILLFFLLARLAKIIFCRLPTWHRTGGLLIINPLNLLQNS